jgi:hypothetical protein
MKKLFVLNGGANVRPDNKSAYLEFDDPKSVFQKAGINTGDVLVYDAMLKALSYEKIQNIQFSHAADERLWPNEAPTATVIRGSNYLAESVDLANVVPLLKKLPGPIVAMGIGAQASTYKKLNFKKGTIEAWKIIADKCKTIGVRGAYSAEIFNDMGIKNVRVIGCPSFYRSLRPSLTIRKTDPASARVGLTLNKYLSDDYATNATKTNRMQRALLEAVAMRSNSRLYSQGEREETLAVFSPREERKEYVDAILERFSLKNHPACQALLTDRMMSFLDVDEWAKDAAANVDVMVGFRLHGNVIALHQGIPAIFFTYDSRIRELAAFFAVPAIEVEDYLPVTLDRILATMDFKAMEHAYRLNFAEYHLFLTENELSHVLPKPIAPAAGQPLSKLNKLNLDYSREEITNWFGAEINFLATENEVLRSRAWQLELGLRDLRQQMQSQRV